MVDKDLYLILWALGSLNAFYLFSGRWTIETFAGTSAGVLFGLVLRMAVQAALRYAKNKAKPETKTKKGTVTCLHGEGSGHE